MSFVDLMNEAIDIAAKIDRLVPRTESYYGYFERNNYRGQKSILRILDFLVDDLATHSADSLVGNGCDECDFLRGYIRFRMEFIHLPPSLLSEILVVPIVSIDTKRRLLRMGMSSREALKLIAALRKRGAWILSYGGYDAVVNRIIWMIPEFRTASC